MIKHPEDGCADGMALVIVRKGTTVLWSIFALNRHARVYGEDWGEFRPEKWLGEQSGKKEKGNGWKAAFMPSGIGQRDCLGQ